MATLNLARRTIWADHSARDLDKARCGLSGAELRQRLWESDPRVAVAGDDAISISPDTLGPGEELLVVEQIRRALGR
jgi:hypothetical protein